MATGGDRPTEDRSGVNFDVELQVPWIPNVLGLHSRKPGVAVVWVLLGRDDHSVHTLVPDQRVIDRGFHEVTLMATVASTGHGQFVVVTKGV